MNEPKRQDTPRGEWEGPPKRRKEEKEEREKEKGRIKGFSERGCLREGNDTWGSIVRATPPETGGKTGGNRRHGECPDPTDPHVSGKRENYRNGSRQKTRERSLNGVTAGRGWIH